MTNQQKIAQLAREAREAGMSYGEYAARPVRVYRRSGSVRAPERGAEPAAVIPDAMAPDVAVPEARDKQPAAEPCKRHPVPEAPSLPPKQCPLCGQQFIHNRKNQIYCSVKCKNTNANRKQNAGSRRLTRERLAEPVQCPVCENVFLRNAVQQVYCSTGCRRKANLRKRKSAHPGGNPK